MRGEILDNATLISSSMVLSRSPLEFFISVSVEKPSLHKQVVQNVKKILTAISEITGCYSFIDKQNVPNGSSQNFNLRVLSASDPFVLLELPKEEILEKHRNDQQSSVSLPHTFQNSPKTVPIVSDIDTYTDCSK
jgi:hypothetical protein